MDNLKWIELRIQTTYEAQDAIFHILNEAGISGIAIEDLTKQEQSMSMYPTDSIYIKAYMQDEQLTKEKLELLQEDVQQISRYGLDIGSGDIVCVEIDEEEWATSWEKYYKPIEISEQMIIMPIWEDQESVDEGMIVIELNPGLAFGTGSHATTALCLRALETYVKPNDVIIDVGCGSGILSIASLLLGADHVIAIDNDTVAINSTRDNAKLNDVTNKLTVKQSNLLTSIQQKAHIIVANIFAEVIMTFIDDAWTRLQPDGLFITSGIIERKRDSVVKELQHVGFHVIDIQQEDGWVCIIAKK